MEYDKSDRMLEIFFKALKGERISVKETAQEYGVSTKSIGRDIKLHCMQDFQVIISVQNQLTHRFEQ